MEKELAAAAGAAAPTHEQASSGEAKCPVVHGPCKSQTNVDWWPNQLKLKSCTNTLICPTPWTKSSTTQKNSRASI